MFNVRVNQIDIFTSRSAADASVFKVGTVILGQVLTIAQQSFAAVALHVVQCDVASASAEMRQAIGERLNRVLIAEHSADDVCVSVAPFVIANRAPRASFARLHFNAAFSR